VLQAHPPRGVIRFNAFEVDVCRGEVRKHGVKIKLQDQPFLVLKILLEHPSESRHPRGAATAKSGLRTPLWILIAV